MTATLERAPGSRVVTDYLAAAGLQKYLDQLGFNDFNIVLALFEALVPG